MHTTDLSVDEVGTCLASKDTIVTTVNGQCKTGLVVTRATWRAQGAIPSLVPVPPSSYLKLSLTSRSWGMQEDSLKFSWGLLIGLAWSGRGQQGGEVPNYEKKQWQWLVQVVQKLELYSNCWMKITWQIWLLSVFKRIGTPLCMTLSLHPTAMGDTAGDSFLDLSEQGLPLGKKLNDNHILATQIASNWPPICLSAFLIDISFLLQM